MNVLFTFALITTLLSSYTDLREGKIPNAITFSAFLIILLAQWYLAGFETFIFALLQSIFIGAIFFPTFVVGWLGGGDIKLFMVIGAAFPYPIIISVLLNILIWGGILAVISIFLRKHLKHSSLFIAKLLQQKKLPYSLAFLGGLLFPLF